VNHRKKKDVELESFALTQLDLNVADDCPNKHGRAGDEHHVVVCRYHAQINN